VCVLLHPRIIVRVYCLLPLLVFAGHVQRADMMLLLQAFLSRAKSELNIEFDITKETQNVVDLKPRRSQPPLPRFPCISFVLHSRVQTIESVLAQFDITVCQVANATTTTTTITSTTTSTTTTNPPANSSFTTTTTI
jgi:hypothetical protein